MADGWNKTNTRNIPEVDYSNTGSGLIQYRKWTIPISKWINPIQEVDYFNAGNGLIQYRKWTIPIPEVDYSNTESGLFKYLHCRCIRQYSVGSCLVLKTRRSSYTARKKFFRQSLPVQFSDHSDPDLLVDGCLCFLES